jgi:hypothetical protein
MAALMACFQKMRSLAEACADQTGYTSESVLRMFHDMPTGARSANTWNLYQKYANTDENRAAERAGIDDEFKAKFAADPNVVALPLEPSELCQADGSGGNVTLSQMSLTRAAGSGGDCPGHRFY